MSNNYFVTIKGVGRDEESCGFGLVTKIRKLMEGSDISLLSIDTIGVEEKTKELNEEIKLLKKENENCDEHFNQEEENDGMVETETK